MNKVIETINSRRTVRKFTNKEVSNDDMALIVEAGRNAPNSWGDQNFGFVIIRNDKVLTKLADITAKYYEDDYARHKFFNAKQIVLVTGSRDRIPVCYCDAGCAVENMFIAAESLGISSVWSNQFSRLADKEDLIEYLDTIGIEKDRIITAVAIFGYADEIPEEKTLISKVIYLD